MLGSPDFCIRSSLERKVGPKSSEGLVVFLEGSDLPIFRSVRALLSTSAGSMGLDVPGTRLVVIHSAPKTAWEFSQEVNSQP